MKSTTNVQVTMGAILITGISVAVILVLLGGILYLLQYGMDNAQVEMGQLPYETNFKKIWQDALALSPLAMIELGLLVLILTQLLRVALLTWFYATIRDYRFMLFSLIILLVLSYSFFVSG